MQKNKFIHPDIMAVCSSATKKLVTMGLLVATVGSAVIPNIAQAQFNPNAGFYNTGEEKKETPEGDENKSDGDMLRNDDENKSDADMPYNEKKEYLQIQTSLDGRKYVVIPPGVTAVVNQKGAFAVIQDDGTARANIDSTIVASGGSLVQLERLATIVLSDGRVFVYRATNEFLEITSPDPSPISDQEPFKLTRPLPVSPCPAPPHPALDENGSVRVQSFVLFLQALPKWIEEVANKFNFNSDTAIQFTTKAFFNAAMKKVNFPLSLNSLG